MVDKTSDSGRCPAVVLAGGRSSRMGSPKAAVLLGGQTMLDRVIERLSPQVASIAVNLNAHSGGALPSGHPAIADTIPGLPGPLAGVLAAMRHARQVAPGASHVLTVPIDAPFFPGTLAARLQGALIVGDEIAVAWSLGEMHPLFALWPLAIADDLDSWIRTDEKRRVRAFIARHASVAVDFPVVATKAGPLDPFLNVNTPQQLEEAEEWLNRLEDSAI
ncbi:molybdopterin-guanine dinucleotide biosynthesis protein A [Sinorhizobium fredii NGR234]|uniref:Molybdenum cofactor guanylyltransferase n=1 Tax=Sinorhizobium fredii (strain NBRC 101917 / NGR234) TaxID=394 RepID=MOBA_SINFN|nr:molybdenum cofactor guanylyltransferase MobA [Sinorhizobium fredii]C3MDF9.1 RecName: Full=Molybdenum cofactor guanylyltransferase; Short=MoCo guanylyltransferase; AltName: Full=GTP:molybdopterin guanylyltransferase; AltName: Full=Mo-MPT guanylyltransferase; AltName: Full=Molybdopterin guanylyltransferase; AltName: Full=Molybdopterin-guanine dinucleotide synthase; Short=MGD synthase [Sinorhizobium fredii NGR234]ACP25478.1 molybdopterin-guanine dinucleotide biosynthesis protein A [Sinorhizobium 